MQLPEEIERILDQGLPPNLSSVNAFSWLPGYIFKKDDGSRITNALILQNKIDRLGLNLIKIPKKYPYKQFVVCEDIDGESGFQSQKLMTTEMCRQLHQLIAEGPIKYYDMTSKNWVITKEGFLYIIDTGKKTIPNILKDKLFYEVSWFVLGDFITDHRSCYMNHPWQLLIRSGVSKHSTYTYECQAEISRLFSEDVAKRKENYNHYLQLARDVGFFIEGSYFDPENVGLQLAIALYLVDLDPEYKHAIVNDAHIIKDVMYQVKYRGCDEFSQPQSYVPPVEKYEIDDFKPLLQIFNK